MGSKDVKHNEGYHEKCHMLYNLLYCHRDIQTLIDEASKIMGNSLILADNSYTVIAITSINRPEDELWQRISSQGYYPQDYIEALISSGQSGLFYNTDLGIMKDDGYTARYYSRKIYANNKNIGFITMVEHQRPLTDDDALLLNELTHVLMVALERAQMGIISHNDKLGMIRDYDRLHGTDYYETLKCYMESDLNKNLTAQKMNIHRNTVEYRINRLIEAYGIDPNDGELAMSYRLSFFLFSSI